ncbi:MAG TPA: hypothetical protein VGE34_03305 [Candidatus Saccharimonadales bacterium]
MQFGNNISSDDTHSNQYASGTTSSQSFSERKEIEKNRQIIGGYHQSKIGQNFAPQGEYVRPRPRAQVPSRKLTRQEMNANGGFIPERPDSAPASRQEMNASSRASFREPPTRGYNPYG